MNANEILTRAAGHLADRAKTYDKPEGERSMKATVEAFKAVTGHELTETQGWLFMALLKAVRSQQGAFKLDSFEDGAAYFALAGESASEANLMAHVNGVCNIEHDQRPITDGGQVAPSWDDAPEWARYLAQDYDGEWYWYKGRPFISSVSWRHWDVVSAHRKTTLIEICLLMIYCRMLNAHQADVFSESKRKVIFSRCTWKRAR